MPGRAYGDIGIFLGMSGYVRYAFSPNADKNTWDYQSGRSGLFSVPWDCPFSDFYSPIIDRILEGNVIEHSYGNTRIIFSVFSVGRRRT